MRKLQFKPVLIFILFLSTLNAKGQLGGLLQKAKDKAAQKAGDMMNGTSSSPNGTSSSSTGKSSRIKINTRFDFKPGDSVIVNDDFSGVAEGASPRSIKTNGAAVIVTVKDIPGKWLALESSASYRLTKQYRYPDKFTVEFDLLAAADKISDMSPVDFGFTNDNSAKEYISDAGEFTSLLYYNNNQVIIANQTGEHINTSFDLTPYANRVMHISIAVNNERMAVYLDKTKIADSQLFAPTDAKNFYISAPLNYNNQSKLLFGNLKIAAFKTGER